MGSHLPFVPGRSLPRQTAHGHTAWTVDASETAGDITAFVPIIEGDGTVQAGVTVGHAGGGTDIDIMTSDDIATLGANVPMPGQMTLFALMQKWGLLDHGSKAGERDTDGHVRDLRRRGHEGGNA
jgi:hypothetical protein